MKESEIKYFYVVFTIPSFSKPFAYRISENENDRLQSFFCENEENVSYKDSNFLRFVTSDGLEVMVNCAKVCYINFLWEPIKCTVIDDPELDDTVRFYFADMRKAVPVSVGDKASFAHFLNAINLYTNTDQFKYFIDEDLEIISINVAKIALIEAPKALVDEGEKDIMNANLGLNDPEQ